MFLTEDLSSKVELLRGREVVTGEKVKYVLKAPKILAKNQCITAKVVLSIPSTVAEFGSLNVDFGFGNVKVDKQLTKNTHFHNFRIGSVNGDLDLPTINSDSIVINNVLGGIDGHFRVSESATLRTVRGDIDTNIELVHGDQEKLVIESVLGNINAKISKNFVGRFSAASATGDNSVEDDGNDGHIHFDKDYKHFKTGIHFSGHSLDDGKARLSVSTVHGDNSIIFV